MDWKAPRLQSAVPGNTTGLNGCGWYMLSSRLVKLLIGEVVRRAPPPDLAGADAHAALWRGEQNNTLYLKAECMAKIAIIVTSALLARVHQTVSAGNSHSDSGFGLGHWYSRPWLLQGVQMSRKRPQGRRVCSCKLSQSV